MCVVYDLACCNHTDLVSQGIVTKFTMKTYPLTQVWVCPYRIQIFGYLQILTCACRETGRTDHFHGRPNTPGQFRGHKLHIYCDRPESWHYLDVQLSSWRGTSICFYRLFLLTQKHLYRSLVYLKFYSTMLQLLRPDCLMIFSLFPLSRRTLVPVRWFLWCRPLPQMRRLTISESLHVITSNWFDSVHHKGDFPHGLSY